MTEVKMKKVQLARAAKIGGERYAAGDTFQGDADVVADLIATGVAQDPKAKVEETSVDTEKAEARAKEILSGAEAEAAKIVDAAKADAKGIVAEAQAEGERLLAVAKADAEKVAEAASKAAESNKKTETDNKSK